MKVLNKDCLTKALLQGVGAGLAAWLIYGLVFEMLIDKEPLQEALFGAGSISFGVVIIIVEVIISYMSLSRKDKKEQK